MKKASVAIVGSGNIGADLMYKLLRSEAVEPKWMIGIDAASEGLRLARAEGLIASHEGAEWLLAQHERPDIVIEATSASAHAQNAPKYAAAGIRAIDLTPAAVGPAVVPAVNLLEHAAAENVSLITCGGQATIPIVAAISAHVPVEYAEIVSSAASPSVGPGTRANIDEFTRTTARGLEAIGRAVRGKAIIILNPAEPPVMMSNTVFAQIPDDSDRALLTAAIEARVREIADYVPGYALKTPPQFAAADPNTGAPASVAVFLQVTGAADYLPAYAGNLDIMTSAATRVAETFAATIAQERARNGF